MNEHRRKFIQGTGTAGALGVSLAAGLLPTRAFAAWNKGAFSATSLPAVEKLLGIAGAANSNQITINAPDIAEDARIVQIEVSSTLPNVQSIKLVVDKNPDPLAADFTLENGMEPYVTTRIKMKETSMVRAFVTSGGRTYTAAKQVKVTIGGCGG